MWSLAGRHGYGDGMRVWGVAVVMLAAGCASVATSTTSAGTLPPPSTIVVTTTTIPRPTPLPLCDAPSYVPTTLPEGVVSPPDDQNLSPDRYTAIEGTSTVVFVDNQSSPKVVLVRGSLPPDEWSARTVRVDVAGFEAAMGTMPDGAWAVAWAESGARCDQYSLIVYPPTTRDEVTAVAEGLRR